MILPLLNQALIENENFQKNYVQDYNSATIYIVNTIYMIMDLKTTNIDLEVYNYKTIDVL